MKGHKVHQKEERKELHRYWCSDTASYKDNLIRIPKILEQLVNHTCTRKYNLVDKNTVADEVDYQSLKDKGLPYRMIIVNQKTRPIIMLKIH